MEQSTATAEDLQKLREEILSGVREGETRLRAELDEERTKRLAAERETAVRGEEKPPQKVYTAEDLDKLVAEGAISQTKASEILSRQAAEQASRSVREEIDSAQTERQRVGKLAEQVELYKEAVPAISQSGSEERGRLQRRYEELRGLGYPEGIETELAALRETFGPPATIRERAARPEASPSGAIGGGGPEPGHEKKAGDGAPTDIPQHLRDHYTESFKKGLYTGWDDPRVKKELEYVRDPHKTRKASNLKRSAA